MSQLEHHEPDRLLAIVDSPMPRLGLVDIPRHPRARLPRIRRSGTAPGRPVERGRPSRFSSVISSSVTESSIVGLSLTRLRRLDTHATLTSGHGPRVSARRDRQWARACRGGMVRPERPRRPLAPPRGAGRASALRGRDRSSRSSESASSCSAPGEPIGMYHWEADQEDFLVLSGEALLIIEGEERPLRQWDFVHCPAETKHIIVGAGDAPCVVLAVGAREHSGGRGLGRLHRGRGRAPARRRRRAGDDRRRRGIRAVSRPRVDAIPRGLASQLTSAVGPRCAVSSPRAAGPRSSRSGRPGARPRSRRPPRGCRTR